LQNVSKMSEINQNKLFTIERNKDYLPWICIFTLFAIAATVLNFQGRVWWCDAGDYVPWSWTIWSRHNSQHVIDPYTFTHILHGVGEFWIISLIFRKAPLVWRLAIAVGVEGTWEIVENTNYVIHRYREATISLDYYGDSIVNSMSDMLACATGFAISYKLRFWRSLALFLLTELVLILWVRDSLIINIIMLIYPIEAIKTWQGGG
jgi:Protein of unknown function (DUF2585)